MKTELIDVIYISVALCMYINACLCCYCVLGLGSFLSSTGSTDADDAFVDRYDCMGYGSDVEEWTDDD